MEWLGPLLDGSAILPHSGAFPLPCVVPCPGGCPQDSYCSAACARAAWGGYHQLLCTGEATPEGENGEGTGARGRPPPRGGDGAAKRSRGESGAFLASCRGGHASGTAGLGSGVATAATSAATLGAIENGSGAAGLSGERRAALDAFKTHADATNDIFHVAARVVAGVLLRAREMLQEEAHVGSSPMPSGSPCGAEAGPEACWAALQAAWLQHGCAWKAVWWEAVALPSDVSVEAAFRAGEIAGCDFMIVDVDISRL